MTDETGEFDFGRVGGGRRSLSLRGDAILPLSIELSDDEALAELELVVEARCHFKVDATREPDLADHLQVRDAQGEVLELKVISPDGVWTTKRVPLSGASTSTIGVGVQAAVLVLLHEGNVVRTLDLRVTPGELVVVRL